MGLVALLASLLSAKSSGHVSLGNVIVGLIGIVALVAFVRHELKVKSPFIPLRTFAKYPAMTWVNVEFMLVNVLFLLALFSGFRPTCKWYVMSASSKQGFSC